MKIIPLTKGYVAVVDDEDYESLAKFAWHAHEYKRRNGSVLVIAYRWPSRSTKNLGRVRRRTIYEDIMGKRPGYVIDHADRNPLNNQRSNLRWASVSQNLANRIARSRIGLKGVQKRRRRYHARLSLARKTIWLGSFASPEEAARAYDCAAKKYFGQFARLNFQKSESPESRAAARLTTVRQAKAPRRIGLWPNATGFRGVSKQPSGSFRAGIWNGGRYRSLGNYKTPQAAARAYDAAAKQQFGERARLNFPERGKRKRGQSGDG